MVDNRQIEDILTRLGAAPARFTRAFYGFEEAKSSNGKVHELNDEWSPTEVLAHVRASNDIMEARLFSILVRDDPHMLAYDDQRWRDVAQYNSLPPSESLEIMRLRRKELVNALRAISQEDWTRTGTHELSGTQSLIDIAMRIADHEDEHCAQIERSMASMRRGEHGPN
ncbi:MAG: DinB family protein [Chloroflexota bacterium]|nr:DinB family protein [Chloroflexota bacterium]